MICPEYTEIRNSGQGSLFAGVDGSVCRVGQGLISVIVRYITSKNTVCFTSWSSRLEIMRKRRSFNDKRRFMELVNQEALDAIVDRIRYGGNPEHKRNPGDFGLTPPAQPRPDKSLCDEIGLFRKAEAERLLRDGVRRGLVSERWSQGFPQNIWSVTADGKPVEAQLENAASGVYHGYPMPQSDYFAQAVLQRWSETDG